jgi:hypothetical protein
MLRVTRMCECVRDAAGHTASDGTRLHGYTPSALASHSSPSPPPPCRLRYKVHGPTAQLNFSLTAVKKAELDKMTLAAAAESIRLHPKHQRSENKSGETYVTWNVSKWVVKVPNPGKKAYVGRFKDLDAAVEARNAILVALGRQVPHRAPMLVPPRIERAMESDGPAPQQGLTRHGLTTLPGRTKDVV